MREWQETSREYLTRREDVDEEANVKTCFCNVVRVDSTHLDSADGNVEGTALRQHGK